MVGRQLIPVGIDHGKFSGFLLSNSKKRYKFKYRKHQCSGNKNKMPESFLHWYDVADCLHSQEIARWGWLAVYAGSSVRGKLATLADPPQLPLFGSTSIRFLNFSVENPFGCHMLRSGGNFPRHVFCQVSNIDRSCHQRLNHDHIVHTLTHLHPFHLI